MRPRSKKRAKQEREYLKVRKEYLNAHQICEVKGCDKWSDDVHHRSGRIGDRLTDKTLFLACCREHHLAIELNPKWAKENGYSLSRLATEKSNCDD